jgi:cyclic pyranopterin phosphate synthase
MIHVYTDGSLNAAAEAGGWAALIEEEGRHRVVQGNVARDGRPTSNRMEITAAIRGLEATPTGAASTVHSDSQYVVFTMTRSWKRRANQDLWERLDQASGQRQVTWEWIRGHAGHPENEFVDAAADFESGTRPEQPRLEDFLKAGAARPRPAGSAAKPRAREPATEAAPALTHLDSAGRARMVDVGGKPETERVAVATGAVVMQPATLVLIRDNAIEKGDVLATARLAGIMGAKQTSHLIPLCHPIPLTQVAVEIEPDHEASAVHITATARTVARTGVEMEAMTAVSIAALTIYDMCKAVDRGMRIESVRLRRKSGGKSGEIVLD